MVWLWDTSPPHGLDNPQASSPLTGNLSCSWRTHLLDGAPGLWKGPSQRDVDCPGWGLLPGWRRQPGQGLGSGNLGEPCDCDPHPPPQECDHHPGRKRPPDGPKLPFVNSLARGLAVQEGCGPAAGREAGRVGGDERWLRLVGHGHWGAGWSLWLPLPRRPTLPPSACCCSQHSPAPERPRGREPSSSWSWGTLSEPPPLPFLSPSASQPLTYHTRTPGELQNLLLKSQSCGNRERRGPARIQPNLERNSVLTAYSLGGLSVVSAHLWSLSFPFCNEGMALTTLQFPAGLRVLSEGLACERDPGNVTEEKPLWK